MGWETRRGRRYYYRKIWDDGKVKSVYCGSGERGELAAREDEERRAARATPPLADVGDLKKEPAAPRAAGERNTPTSAGEFARLLTSQPDESEKDARDASEVAELVDDGGAVDTPARASTPFEVAARLGYYSGSHRSADSLLRHYTTPRRRYRPPRS